VKKGEVRIEESATNSLTVEKSFQSFVKETNTGGKKKREELTEVDRGIRKTERISERP